METFLVVVVWAVPATVVLLLIIQLVLVAMQGIVDAANAVLRAIFGE